MIAAELHGYREAAAKDLEDPFDLSASSYLLKRDGKALWARSPDKKLPPASLTKIMTALITLKNSKLEEIAVVSTEAAMETGSRLGLKPGERMYVGFLLAATLLNSANDACHALSDHVAGNEGRFVRMMNAEARALGMSGTHFTNACGHDGKGHYSTARDLAILAEAALMDKEFSDIVSIAAFDITTAGGGRAFRLSNHNELIGRYPGAMGVKSGYTLKAGKCVIAVAERGGVKIMLVLLNAPNRWWDAEAMLDKGFHGAGSRAAR